MIDIVRMVNCEFKVAKMRIAVVIMVWWCGRHGLVLLIGGQGGGDQCCQLHGVGVSCTSGRGDLHSEILYVHLLISHYSLWCLCAVTICQYVLL